MQSLQKGYDVTPKIQKNENDIIMNILKTVEKTIKESDIYLTERQLLTRLPTKMTLPALQVVLEVFERANKIIYDRDNTIVWVGTDKLQNNMFQREFTILH